MTSGTAICTLCLGLVLTTSAAVLHGNRRDINLKDEAIRILTWAEGRGGEVFNEIVIGRPTGDRGRLGRNPYVLSLVRTFIREVCSQVQALQVQANGEEARFPVNGGHQRHRRHSDSLILPGGTSTSFLDYDDVLNIIGDYTKSYANVFDPWIMSPPIGRRSARGKDEIQALVENLLSQLEKAKSWNRQRKQ